GMESPHQPTFEQGEKAFGKIDARHRAVRTAPPILSLAVVHNVMISPRIEQCVIQAELIGVDGGPLVNRLREFGEDRRREMVPVSFRLHPNCAAAACQRAHGAFGSISYCWGTLCCACCLNSVVICVIEQLCERLLGSIRVKRGRYARGVRGGKLVSPRV